MNFRYPKCENYFSISQKFRLTGAMMDDYIPNFLAETAEALAALNDDLVRLEATPDDDRLIGGIFRTLHNIKGTTGFLDLPRLGRICHAGETVLSQMREGALRPSSQVISILHRCADAIRRVLDSIELSGDEGSLSDDELIAELRMLHNPGSSPAPQEPSGDSLALQALFDATPGSQDRAPMPILPFASAGHAPLARERARRRVLATKVTGDRRTIRVEVGLLEELMTTVSELAVARNRLLELLCWQDGSPFTGPLLGLSSITSDLQEIVMKTRMQPIGAVWSVLPRLVRDLACKLGKKINLVMEGADTEFDRQVLELIKDPLIHIVRNAADHGLETPEVRSASGKPETGRIRLCAFLDGSCFVIRIEDDGRGLDVARIRRKAVESGLAAEAEVVAMTDADVSRFILRPGFSTAAEVSSVSGRGVGMDVARANIERIGGTIHVESRPGQGTTFVVKIPLKLAIAGRSIPGRPGVSLLTLDEVASF
jgi:two-component system chemotaxis sensor kinase CheA